jgi:hypothetical protein
MRHDVLPASLSHALKEWAVTIRALREGRQILLLRKGGIIEAGGEFAVEARDVALFPTYLHEEEQAGAIQPCYRAWLDEEQARKPEGEVVRIDAVARITDVIVVTDFDALLRIGSQHIYSEKLIRYRIENEPNRPLYCLFVRAYDLPEPVTLPLEMDYYGCKSWITLAEPIGTEGAVPAMGDAAYAERVRVTKDLLTRS